MDHNYNGQLWVKDVHTGEEKPIAEGGYYIIGWESNHHLYIKRSDTINKLNLETGVETEEIPFALTEALSYPYLIHQEQYGKVKVTNLETRASYEPEINMLDRVRYFRTLSGTPKVLIFYAPDRAKPETALAVFDMATGETHHFVEPANHLFVDGQWIDSSQFLIHTRKIGTSNETTYFVGTIESVGHA